MLGQPIYIMCVFSLYTVHFVTIFRKQKINKVKLNLIEPCNFKVATYL